ncbi:hypothetical protein PFBG_03138 [Plasmodium falciparum 7G8]|uniref:Uncharacterized protein n=1 Tax=Plasmodium falciparum (isolate 7G8) TaxID=57266 RepID=W7FC35_PLAF8|nr:hypothetical protein PFBG_03138 [Plasmodium falciparum 7G8]
MEKKKFIKIRAIKYSMNEKKEKNFYQLFFILYKDNFTFIVIKIKRRKNNIIILYKKIGL